MSYKPVKKSKADRDSISRQPKDDEIISTVVTDEGRKVCFIEWREEDENKWILAEGTESFISLDAAI